MLTDENLQKLSLSTKVIKERWRRLKQPALQKVRRAYVQDGMQNEAGQMLRYTAFYSMRTRRAEPPLCRD